MLAPSAVKDKSKGKRIPRGPWGDSTAFEQQVHRIHELLEDSGASVTWNDHLPDPDNPSQPRQIDITVKRDGLLTLIECRHHKARQGVKWIEELMGRRQSLRADSVIAVSSSGFTPGALSKAKQFLVITRDLRKLSDSEVRAWGAPISLTIYWYQYSDLHASILFKPESIGKIDRDALMADITSYRVLQSFFSAAAEKLTSLNLLSGEHQGSSVRFHIRLGFPDLKLSGESVLEAEFQGRAQLISRDVTLAAIHAYENPSVAPTTEASASIESFDLGETSIIRHGRRISIFLDISKLELPPFCQFRFFRVLAPEEVDHEALHLVGWEKTWVRGKMTVDIGAIFPE